jgi:methyl-accepting chemotaxis protein
MASASGNVEAAISEINDAIGSVSRHVASIALAVEDQVKATKEISNRMNGVSASFANMARERS